MTIKTVLTEGNIPVKIWTDGITSAYEHIDVVMANQEDLVEVVHMLKQILCVKG
jgi:RNA-splicing ligase RtcB